MFLFQLPIISSTIPPSKCYNGYKFSASKVNSSSQCQMIHKACPDFDGLKTYGGNRKKKHSWAHGVCYRHSLWESSGPCHGEFIREICNYGLGDLSLAKEKKCLIGNKFNIAVDPKAILCQVKEVLEFSKSYEAGLPQNNVV